MPHLCHVLYRQTDVSATSHSTASDPESATPRWVSPHSESKHRFLPSARPRMQFIPPPSSDFSASVVAASGIKPLTPSFFGPLRREESVQKDQEKIEKSENGSAVAVFRAGRAPKGSREESQTNTC
ncbi:hypothetical protein CRENBAI_007970 [Crenichthys baileyi]|uniref:Uncharacterized protein n=1 Tax=Crenichthys baileyi TaxID=28760 RepID=A0AAV9SF51_9TELE